MKRRDFLKSTTGAMLSGMILAPKCTPTAGDRAAARSLGRIGLQLYTVRSLMQQDVGRTLDLVAGAGYQEVEFAGYFDRTPQEVRAQLERSGLEAPGGHIALENLRDTLAQVVDAANVVGHRYLILPWLAEADRQTSDDYRRIADEMNTIGDACRTAGVQFAYHNHDFEFEEVEGSIPYDLLLERCDAELVRMELDLYWTLVGGRDPLEFFEQHPERFPLCHVKDRDRSGEMVDVGEGTIDFGAIFAQSEEAGLAHYFVEHDNPPDPEESIKTSHRYLTRLTF
jgi:sugar phosphate isomerase/epimerase